MKHKFLESEEFSKQGEWAREEVDDLLQAMSLGIRIKRWKSTPIQEEKA